MCKKKKGSFKEKIKPIRTTAEKKQVSLFASLGILSYSEPFLSQAILQSVGIEQRNYS